jgi:flavin reductase (DIM6/NTAB) family NADH-FMN oxidoreductase RutF
VSDADLISLPPEGIERRPVTAASRLLLGGPVTLLTVTYRGQHNVMPLAWCAPLSSSPPLLGVAVEQSRHTADMVSHAEAFALNFPTRRLIHHVQYLGSLTGADVDKFEATQLETFPSVHVPAPLIEGCAAWVECELEQAIPIGDHILFVGLPVAVHVDPEAFDDRWLVGTEEVRPLHFLGGTLYSILEGVLEARVPRPEEAPEHALAERIEEELELTQEARERREELLGELEREVEQGKLIDISKAGLTALPELDLPLQIVVPERDDD